MKSNNNSCTTSQISNTSATKVTILLIMLTVFIYAPILYRMAMTDEDYIGHAEVAAKILATHTISTPHPLFHVAEIILHELLPIDLARAGFLTVLIATVVTAVVVFKHLCMAAGSTLRATIFTLGLLLAAPVSIFALADGRLYLGYIGINTYHNPTILLLKPIAVTLFFLADRGFNGNYASRGSTVWLGCILAMLAALAKPSYTICLIPALLLLVIVRKIGQEPLNSKLLGLGILIPSCAILIIQYLFTYSTTQIYGSYVDESHIVLAPLAFMKEYSSWLLPKFFLSILFPATLALCYGGKVFKEPRMLLAWLTFAFGAGFTYLLAESGPRFCHGNFGWSGQITLFILFIASTDFLCHQLRQEEKIWRADRKAIVCLCMLTLHVVSGLGFYAAQYYLGRGFW